MKQALQGLLSGITKASTKQLSAALICLALLTGISTLNRGLQSDDFIHRSILTNDNLDFNTQINHFFEFLQPSETRPWWFHPELKIKFWRPLSAASHWLDYQLWPNSPKLMHWHNILWSALLVSLLLIFFKRILATQTHAFLATLIFCLDFSHFANISWIANRNSLIASTFIVISLIFYLDWKKSQRKLFLGLSLLAFLLALLSAESSIILLAIIFLYELLFLNKSNYSKNITFILIGPLLFFSVTAIWFTYYLHSGFGIENNSMYINPSSDLIYSLKLIALKVPVFIVGNFLGVEGFYNIFPPSAKIIISTLCAIIVFIVAFILRDLFQSKTVRFLSAATIVSFIPACFVAVLDMRLGIYASIFSSALLSIFIINLFHREDKKIAKSLLLIFFLLSHIAFAPLQWASAGLKYWHKEKISLLEMHQLQTEFQNKEIFILNYPSPIDAYYYDFMSFNNNHNIYVLSNNLTNYTVSSVESNTLLLNSSQGLAFTESDLVKVKSKKPVKNAIYARAALNSMLPKTFHFSKGDSFSNNIFSIKVLDINTEELVKTLEFTFNKSNDENLFFLWDTNKKEFSPLSLKDIYETGEILTIRNW